MGPQRARGRRAAYEEREEDERADDRPPEDDDRRLELVDADLDEEERRAPDRGDEQQAEVAPGHGATLDAIDALGPSHAPGLDWTT